MQCVLCQKQALLQCNRCGRATCFTHLHVLNNNEICCVECAVKLVECLQAGHDWGPWQAAGPETDKQVRVCKRCHEQEVRPDQQRSIVRVQASPLYG